MLMGEEEEVGTFRSCSISLHGKPQNSFRNGQIFKIFQIFRSFQIYRISQIFRFLDFQYFRFSEISHFQKLPDFQNHFRSLPEVFNFA